MDFPGVNHMPALVNACANLLYLLQPYNSIMSHFVSITSLVKVSCYKELVL